ncbi:MAG TPA: glycosyltransferase family 2 protein [Terracidiphilus sp.]|nr:glycosyltransferase family 2 protein [Terracidiphilus sp.]
MDYTISVIIPVYNRCDRVKYAVDSVLAQTVPVLEIILVDDGSFDGTSELLPRYIEDNPTWRERVIYVRQDNQGPGGARNTGITRAKGDWIAFNDSDDIWLPYKLEWQIRALERYGDNCDLCFTDAWFSNNPYFKSSLFSSEGRKGSEPMGVVDDPAQAIVRHNYVWCQTVLARTHFVRTVGGCDPKLRWSEDRDFLFRAALMTKFCYVNLPMVLIDRSPTDVRHSGEAENWRKEDFRLRMDQYRLEKQLCLSGGLELGLRRSIRRNLRCLHSQWANFYLWNDNFSKAREVLCLAQRYHRDSRIMFKLALTAIVPKLAKRLFAGHSQRETQRVDFISWRAE